MTTIMRPQLPVGIVGYGAYIPRYRITVAEIAEVWKGDQNADMPVDEKSVPGPDEDVVTMSIEAARNAMRRARVDPARVRAVWIGSESHPYAVKPSGTIVAQALGITTATLSADFEFACKAGTEAMQSATALVGAGMGEYALAIGMDTAQGRPGDALEYTAGAGGAAYLMGPAEEAVAVIEGSYSYVSDTPDFWRREYQTYP
ncbi:MAG: hydroxymethylglutaryl-CoA synthase, partial [Chloroflexota bacterium]|nr:hydroxymethylglutaryl-CoA synthase [Chloroflexota bacterium]